jgi:hypothetical protein
LDAGCQPPGGRWKPLFAACGTEGPSGDGGETRQTIALEPEVVGGGGGGGCCHASECLAAHATHKRVTHGGGLSRVEDGKEAWAWGSGRGWMPAVSPRAGAGRRCSRRVGGWTSGGRW